MKLLDSLLDAIVRLEGDALVMHVGEKPYVITTSAAMSAYRGPLAWGQVELSSRVLTFDAVSSMLAQILPADQQRALDELGAIEHEILPPDGILDRFTVVAARGGEDVWVEVRRKPTPPAAVDAPAATPEAEAGLSTDEIEEPAAAAPEDVQIDEPLPVEEPVRQEATVAEEPVLIEEALAPASVGEHPVEQHQLEPHQGEQHQESAAEDESKDAIIVALPGEASEEVRLDRVPDDAIQLIDDEAQSAPTEEEVDAMLAATASQLLSSGLSVDTLEEAPHIEPVELIVDAHEEHASGEFAPDEQLDEEVVFLQEVAPREPIQPEASPELALPIEEIPEPAAPAASDFVLSPPPTIVPEEAAPELNEPVFETPQGTPLFSEDAIAAAAAVEPAPAAEVQPVEIAPVAADAGVEPVETAPIAADAEVERVEIAPIAGDEPELIPEVLPDATLGVSPVEADADLAAHAAIWSSALTEWASEPAQAAIASSPSFEPIASIEPPPPTPATVEESAHIPEMSMEATPEHRHEESYAGSSSSAPADEARSGVVVPLSRPPAKTETITTPFTPAEDAALMRTLRLAATRGAATVYVVAQSKPMIRVDGEIVPLDPEPALSAADVDRLVLELVPPRRRDALQNGPVEWLCDIPEIGRVRCLTFRDHRGPGVLFRMFPPQAISADQLALSPEVQALCQQSDGLVLVAGARSSGKSTLLNAFVDLINRTRSDHVITIESQIGFVHESRKSFISQRETRGDGDLAASLARAALREDPDVMMIEELKSAELVLAAIEAAESGRLVLASVPAASTIAALERVIELVPADRRAKARGSLATSLRGVIAQVLLRRVTGGRVAAREILLNTPAVSTLVLEGKMFQLPVALDSGRRHGMVPLTDSLALHVREGTVNPGEAYRKALDRAALIAALKRDGVDTSFAERLA